MRIQEIHIVNMPSYAQTMVNMVLSVLKKKIANRVSYVRRVSKLNIVYNKDDPDSNACFFLVPPVID